MSLMSLWRYRYPAVALLIAISAWVFLGIDAYNARNAGRVTPLALETELDRMIPLVPSFVFAYLLYYPWLLLPLTVLRRAHDFLPVAEAFVWMQLVAWATFLALPSYVPRSGVASVGLSSELLRALYAVDPGWNAFPSLHVGHSVLVAIVFFRHRRELFPFVAAGTCLIAASTLLIKQHYVLDVLGGAVLAWLCMTAPTLRTRAQDMLNVPAS